MHPELPSNTAKAVFRVSYQNASGARNLDFQGDGTLSIHTEEPVYRFEGSANGRGSRPHSLHFRSDAIRNVTYGGNTVQFHTQFGKSGAKHGAFVFFCESDREALEVARSLPRTQDQDFATRLDFGQRLSRLPGAKTPWTSVTNVIIALNVAAFIAMGLAGAGWIMPESMRPYIGFAANNAAATTDGEWWRLVTCMFVHYGVLHLALNMWALHQTGRLIERLLGRSAFAVAYLGAGLIASFTSLIWHGDKTWSAGASGAVFGVYGMMIGFMLREKQSIPKPVLSPLMRSSLTFAGYNLVFGFTIPQIDNAAHIGGFLGGILLGWAMALPLESAQRARLAGSRLQQGIAVIAACCIAGFTLSPRYDYNVGEELEWSDLMAAKEPQETALVEKQKSALASYRNGSNRGEFARLIEQEMLPFYEKWQAEVAALNLQPDKRTAKRRAEFSTELARQIQTYRDELTKINDSPTRSQNLKP